MWNLTRLGPSSLKSSTVVVVSGSTALSARQDALRLGGLMLAVAGDSDSDYLKVTSLSTLGRELIAFELVNHFLKSMPAVKIFS